LELSVQNVRLLDGTVHSRVTLAALVEMGLMVLDDDRTMAVSQLMSPG
jgi:hypothetical protein